MPREPKIEHSYLKHTGNAEWEDYGHITATSVLAHAVDEEGKVIGSHISIVHPRTLGYEHPDVIEHNYYKEDPQMVLFQHHGPIAENYIAHSKSGHTAPIVLGIAANLSKQMFNEVPAVPHNLSKHSVRVVEALKDSVPNYATSPKEPTNALDKGDYTDLIASAGARSILKDAAGISGVSPAQIEQGSETIKQVVRRRRQKTEKVPVTTPTAPTPTTEQLKIPGI